MYKILSCGLIAAITILPPIEVRAQPQIIIHLNPPPRHPPARRPPHQPIVKHPRHPAPPPRYHRPQERPPAHLPPPRPPF